MREVRRSEFVKVSSIPLRRRDKLRGVLLMSLLRRVSRGCCTMNLQSLEPADTVFLLTKTAASPVHVRETKRGRRLEVLRLGESFPQILVIVVRPCVPDAEESKKGPSLGYMAFGISCLALMEIKVQFSLFRNETLNPYLVACRTIAHVKEFSSAQHPQQGCCSIDNATLADIEAKALLLALHAVHSYHSRLHHIFITNRDLHDAIKLDASRSTWQTDLWIRSIIDIVSVLGNPEIYVIPHSWNAATHRLAIHGLSQHSLSLFHQGRELPHWLMKIFLSNGFTLER
ncbi:uncharacterized protein LOC120273641 [Dioscorea cayenensis subsp. rotundata]|uniref:Uncharacterized protein LOC120273641 n=1 Tax=Dioscorea cayennensis subsp. rotundata TaxID=55577 RepID=A0AB40C8V7_DIOCR|nr:uncharacterized protein LOC120273641 [Dioscorea cayenensis subsp. rotundata]